jgi:hypothetical protein
MSQEEQTSSTEAPLLGSSTAWFDESGTVLIPSNVSLEALRPAFRTGLALSAYGKRKDRRRITQQRPPSPCLWRPNQHDPYSGTLALWLCVSAFQRVCLYKELSYHLVQVKEGEKLQKNTKKLALEMPLC